MPKVLADRRDQRVAGERGEDLVRYAEEQERRGVRRAGGKRGSKGSASSSSIAATAGDNDSYFQDSIDHCRVLQHGHGAAIILFSMIIVGI